eukprot:46713_1
MVYRTNDFSFCKARTHYSRSFFLYFIHILIMLDTQEPLATIDSPRNYLWLYFFFSLTIALLLLTRISRKWYMLFIGFYYILQSKDKECNMDHIDIHNMDSKSIHSIQSKTLILIRHGESVWNEIFNRKILTLSFPLRLLQILLKEMILFLSLDSYLFDSPLSTHGTQQCNHLRAFLKQHSQTQTHEQININLSEHCHINSTQLQCIEMLNANQRRSKSIVVCSPLRRCIETASLALYDRLQTNKKEKIYLLSTLQELTRNIDGLSLSVNNRELPPISKHIQSNQSNPHMMNEVQWQQWFDDKLDISMKDGVKCKYKRGDERIHGFIEWMFSGRNSEYETVIVCGHSIWIKTFFNAFLPRNVSHDAKQYKMHNAGVVTLAFTQYVLKNGTTKYNIDPHSIHSIFKGFEVK